MMTTIKTYKQFQDEIDLEFEDDSAFLRVKRRGGYGDAVTVIPIDKIDCITFEDKYDEQDYIPNSRCERQKNDFSAIIGMRGGVAIHLTEHIDFDKALQYLRLIRKRKRYHDICKLNINNHLELISQNIKTIATDATTKDTDLHGEISTLNCGLKDISKHLETIAENSCHAAELSEIACAIDNLSVKAVTVPSKRRKTKR